MLHSNHVDNATFHHILLTQRLLCFYLNYFPVVPGFYGSVIHADRANLRIVCIFHPEHTWGLDCWAPKHRSQPWLPTRRAFLFCFPCIPADGPQNHQSRHIPSPYRCLFCFWFAVCVEICSFGLMWFMVIVVLLCTHVCMCVCECVCVSHHVVFVFVCFETGSLHRPGIHIVD